MRSETGQQRAEKNFTPAYPEEAQAIASLGICETWLADKREELMSGTVIRYKLKDSERILTVISDSDETLQNAWRWNYLVFGERLEWVEINGDRQYETLTVEICAN